MVPRDSAVCGSTLAIEWPRRLDECEPKQFDKYSAHFPPTESDLKVTPDFCSETPAGYIRWQQCFIDFARLILPLVLYGCETWSLTLVEKRCLGDYVHRGEMK
jgi:hypothetical protein